MTIVRFVAVVAAVAASLRQMQPLSSCCCWRASSEMTMRRLLNLQASSWVHYIRETGVVLLLRVGKDMSKARYFMEMCISSGFTGTVLAPAKARVEEVTHRVTEWVSVGCATPPIRLLRSEHVSVESRRRPSQTPGWCCCTTGSQARRLHTRSARAEMPPALESIRISAARLSGSRELA